MAKFDIDRLRKLVTDATTTGSRPIPRIIVSVADRDGIVFEQASGVKVFADGPARPNNAVAMDSIFWFASQTKLVTSLAAALLIEKGVFTLDSLAQDFIPELASVKILKGYDENGNAILVEPTSRITIRHLFTHMAGTKFTTSSADLDRYRNEHGLEIVWHGPKAPRETVTGLPLSNEPGQGFSYAHDTDLLAFAVEGASGLDFEAYCQKHIFEPLGVSDMVWRRETFHEARQVDLCFRNSDDTGFKGIPLGVVKRPQACSGGGGLFGSAQSYMKLLRTLLNDGVSPDTGKRIVQKTTIDMMATPLVTDPKFAKAVWDYLKHDMPSDPAAGREIDTSRQVGMTIKIITKDIEGGRRKGTFYGEGYANTFWFVDRAAGICMTLLTDIAPFGDPGVIEFAKQFEHELYRNLVDKLVSEAVEPKTTL